MTEMTEDWIETERRRAIELLSPEWTGVTLEPMEPDPRPEQVGALGGLGRLAPGRDVRVAVYVCDGWGAAGELASSLQASIEGEGRYARTTVNGPLVFLGVTGTEEAEGRRLLGKLASAFAGWE